jgi:protein-tyrosine kinase
MSIIERAMEKIQGANAAARSARPVAAAPSAAPREPAAPAKAVESLQVRAQRQIELDVPALQQAGMLAGSDASERLREEFRHVKWPLLNRAMGNVEPHIERANMIMVTSALAGDGKTFFSLNLAISMALARDAQIVLIDGDIAKQHLSRMWNLRSGLGITSLLQDDKLTLDEVAVQTNVEGLLVVPAGPFAQTGPELFAGRRMQQLLSEWSRNYPRYVFLWDTPPLLATNESQVLARLVGQVVLVVSASKTPQAAVVEAVSMLDKSKSVSCVLNQLSGGPRHNYYGSYYSDQQEQLDETAKT